MLSVGQEVWIMYKKKPEKWRVVEPDYNWMGNKFIKLRKNNDFTLTTFDKCFRTKESCK